MKIVVTGGREWISYKSILDGFERMCKAYDISPTDIILIHGDCRGLDRMAAELGELLGMDVRGKPAHWGHDEDCPAECREVIGRAAGVIRNQKMLDENPDIELAMSFHHDLEKSKGTGDMVRRIEKAGITHRHFDK